MDQPTATISNPDPYYLKSVADFSENAEVVSSEDVYSQSGIKLINQGARLDKSIYERLVHHKLAVSPIDRSLTVKDGVTPLSLAHDAARLIDEDVVLGRMASALPDALLLRNTLAQIVLTPPLAFKLTLARENRPALYQHGIRVALISLYLGACLHLKPGELTALAMAAIFHDLGELHIDSALLDRAHALTDKERQHIYAHPMIAYLILKEYPEYHPQVSTAVLDHHERLDGSGYPRNIKGSKINKLSQILAVAEVAGSLCSSDGPANACARVELILKLNPGQFRADLVGYLSAIAKRGQAAAAPETRTDLATIRTRLESIAKILADWNQALAPFRGSQLADCLAYASERLANLEKALFDAGYNSAGLHALTNGVEEDPASLSELELLVHETGWQLRDSIYEIRRRWPDLASAADPAAAALQAWTGQAEAMLWP
jgi:HD-GYP domain-containing protein (c-di-GMP phosphodiesterase class II)